MLYSINVSQARENIDPTTLSIKNLFSKSLINSLCTANNKKSIGLWTISEEKSPVGISSTKRIYEELLNRIIQYKPSCTDLIDSQGIGVIIDHLSKSGVLQKNAGDALAAVEEAHQNVDYILFPEVYSQSGNILFSLRLNEVSTGKTIAVTPSTILPKSWIVDNTADNALSLDNAAKQAAKHLMQQITNLSDIQASGIYFEATGSQPAAGRYIQEKIINALTELGSNSLTNKALKVRGITIQPSDLITSNAADLDSKAIAASTNSYDLGGRYWIRNNSIDLKINLTRPDGGVVSWQGNIKLDDLKGLAIRPENKASLQSPLPKAGFAFQVTTQRGTSPAYKSGEELKILIRSGRDAWVYCYYIDSKSQVSPILPASKKYTNNKVAAQSIRIFPSPSVDPLTLIVNSETSGEELISCFASTKDISSIIPNDLVPEKAGIIPYLTLDKLRQIYSEIKDARISESIITINII